MKKSTKVSVYTAVIDGKRTTLIDTKKLKRSEFVRSLIKRFGKKFCVKSIKRVENE